MTVSRFLSELHESEPVLSSVGWINVFALVCCVISYPFDPREILGVNPWIKPMKFAGSIALYVFTLGWFLRYLLGPKLLLNVVRGGVAVAMLGEIALIWLQSARGVRSHFNVDTGFDAGVFGVTGLLILANSILIVVTLGLFFWDYKELPGAYLWGIRLGLFLFFLGSLEGMIMLVNQGHAVGVADGGPGLPFINWSTEAGDLRVAHLLGIHALQVIPLAGYRLSRLGGISPGLQTVLLLVVSFVYAGLGYALFRQAMGGTPVLSM